MPWALSVWTACSSHRPEGPELVLQKGFPPSFVQRGVHKGLPFQVQTYGHCRVGDCISVLRGQRTWGSQGVAMQSGCHWVTCTFPG